MISDQNRLGPDFGELFLSLERFTNGDGNNPAKFHQARLKSLLQFQAKPWLIRDLDKAHFTREWFRVSLGDLDAATVIQTRPNQFATQPLAPRDWLVRREYGSFRISSEITRSMRI